MSSVVETEVSMSVHQPSGTETNLNLFSVGEFFFNSSTPDEIYRVKSIRRVESSIWYRCYVLKRPVFEMNQKVSSAFKEVIKLAHEVGVIKSQIVLWTAREVDVEHAEVALEPAIVFSRMDCVQRRFLAGERNKFFLAAALLPSKTVAKPRLALLDPGPAGAQPPYFVAKTVGKEVQVLAPSVIVNSRSDCLERGRSWFQSALEAELSAVQGQGVAGQGQFRLEFTVPMDRAAWDEAFAKPLEKMGIACESSEVLESSTYRDGGSVKHQVTPTHAEAFSTKTEQDIQIFKQVLGMHCFTSILSPSLVATVCQGAQPGIRIWYKVPPLSVMRVELNFGVMPFNSNQTAVQANLSSRVQTDVGVSSNSRRTHPATSQRRQSTSSATEENPTLLSEVRTLTSNLSSFIFGAPSPESSTTQPQGGQSLSRFQVVSGPVRRPSKHVPLPHGSVASRNASKATSSRKWTKEEHARFTQGLRKFGAGEWLKIAEFVGSRTPHQVQIHGTKYLRRFANTNNGPSSQY